ncbi:hypothetical protein OIU85_003494 [Salix viminalis]|uniref:Uncharacterized protein n=1 Tax=Salix viminalis TaxID=40686 RepID=A0A9Q0PZW5_SALVM|nr:hypothetical protein OIU85_003494 [Salix viminalis]
MMQFGNLESIPSFSIFHEAFALKIPTSTFIVATWQWLCIWWFILPGSYILPSNFEEVATGVLKVLNNLALLDIVFHAENLWLGFLRLNAFKASWLFCLVPLRESKSSEEDGYRDPPFVFFGDTEVIPKICQQKIQMKVISTISNLKDHLKGTFFKDPTDTILEAYWVLMGKTGTFWKQHREIPWQLHGQGRAIFYSRDDQCGRRSLNELCEYSWYCHYHLSSKHHPVISFEAKVYFQYQKMWLADRPETADLCSRAREGSNEQYPSITNRRPKHDKQPDIFLAV